MWLVFVVWTRTAVGCCSNETPEGAIWCGTHNAIRCICSAAGALAAGPQQVMDTAAGLPAPGPVLQISRRICCSCCCSPLSTAFPPANDCLTPGCPCALSYHRTNHTHQPYTHQHSWLTWAVVMEAQLSTWLSSSTARRLASTYHPSR